MNEHYKPLLAVRLEFPPDWEMVSIVIGADACSFTAWTHADSAGRYANAALPGVFCFFHFEEIINALQGPEKENRQLHVMADLVSWYCKGVGIGGPLKGGNKNQNELPF
jgi:hypothetical protein